ncbi:MAG: TolC family protein [Candidatus Hydrogenedentes bacterium]|nr:TolC family protein [Candidatus Hydrogenedentota bacterium]
MSKFPYYILACLTFWAVPAYVCYAVEAVSQPELTAFNNPTGPLSLADVLALALEQHPDLKVYSWDIRAAEAREIQAGLRPNPELSLDIEDIRIGGSNSTSASSRTLGFSGVDGLSAGISRSEESPQDSVFGETEITLALSQLVELGGKRAKRVIAASRERDVVAWDYEVARVDVLTKAAQAFYAVVAAQEHVDLSKTLADLANQAHATIQTLVQAGKVSAIEESRSQVELGQLSIERDTAIHELNAARIELAGTWGSNEPRFDTAIGSFPESFAPMSAEDLEASIDRSPYMSRWVAELDRRDAVIALERANGKPDLTVTLGLRSSGSGGADSGTRDLSSADGLSITRGSTDSDRDARVVLGFSLPLPLFNRNQGSIAEAEYLARKASDERRATQAAISNALAVASERASAFHAAYLSMKITVVPTAQEAFDAVQEGYLAGKFGLLDVLIAQRALFDAQRQMTQSQASFQQTIVEIERFTGMTSEPAQPVELVEPMEKKQ